MSGDDTFLPPSGKRPPGPLDGDDTFLPPEDDDAKINPDLSPADNEREQPIGTRDVTGNRPGPDD